MHDFARRARRQQCGVPEAPTSILARTRATKHRRRVQAPARGHGSRFSWCRVGRRPITILAKHRPSSSWWPSSPATSPSSMPSAALPAAAAHRAHRARGAAASARRRRADADRRPADSPRRGGGPLHDPRGAAHVPRRAGRPARRDCPRHRARSRLPLTQRGDQRPGGADAETARHHARAPAGRGVLRLARPRISPRAAARSRAGIVGRTSSPRAAGLAGPDVIELYRVRHGDVMGARQSSGPWSRGHAVDGSPYTRRPARRSPSGNIPCPCAPAKSWSASRCAPFATLLLQGREGEAAHNVSPRHREHQQRRGLPERSGGRTTREHSALKPRPWGHCMTSVRGVPRAPGS